MGKGKGYTKNPKEFKARQSGGNKPNISLIINKDNLFGIPSSLIICVFLALTTFIVYWQVTHYGFINMDDNLYVTGNRHVKSGLTSESILWSFSFSEKEKTYWQPLTWLSHILDSQLYGLNPGMHHLTNLIFHIASCVLLFLVFNRMTGALWKSAFLAALFALHPLNVDSVAWVAERKNLLSTFFWMLTLLSYAWYCERPGLYRYLIILLTFGLGLLAKPMLVTLPFVLLLMDYWPLGRLVDFTVQSVSRLVMEKVPLFVVSTISVYLSILSVAGQNNVGSLELVPMKLRISNALVSYLNYIGKMIWPQNLAIFYPYPTFVPFWKAAGSGLFLLFVSLLVVLVAKQRSYLAVGWFWFLGTLIPVIGLVQTGLWPAMADRWAYIPLIGLFIVFTWGIPELLLKWRYKRTGLTVIGMAVIILLTTTTCLQLRHWKNSITLYEHALHVTLNNFVAHNNLGYVLTKQGKIKEAISHCSEALRINPSYAEAHINLGVALEKQGRTAEAISHYSEALRINPDLEQAQNNIGIILGKQGKIADAIRHLSEALRINQNYDNAHCNLGVALFQQGKISEAINHFSEALRINPDNAKARSNLKAALEKKNRVTDQISH